jgi:hypothetical protein
MGHPVSGQRGNQPQHVWIAHQPSPSPGPAARSRTGNHTFPARRQIRRRVTTMVRTGGSWP